MWKHGRLAAVVLASVVAAEDFLCRCDWKDNYWLHIAEDLGHIFASPTDFFEAPTSDANRSRRWQGQWQLLQLAVTDGLCRLDPSRTVPLDAGRLRFNPSWVQLDEKGQPRNVLPEIFFGELCVPGMIATNLLCALHFTFTFQEPNFFLAGRHARRLQQLLPWVQSCWAAPWAALHLEDLENFAERWAQRTALKPVTSLLFQGVSHPIPAASLSPALRHCWPVRSSGCWPKLSRVDKASCSMCCDPRFTRGDPTCFLGEWTFERCCQSEDPAGWPPGPKPVEVEAIPDELLEELRRELSTATTSTALPSSFSTERRVRAQQTLKRWIEEAPKGVGRQKIFPELDLLVATNACVGHETEVPWFLLGSDASLRRPDDGVALATAAGALCGQGLEVEEMTSLVGRRATIPSQGPVRGFHKLETYGLELMLPCQLQTSPAGACFCGAHPCRPDMDFAKACCRDGRNVEWRGLGILTGEMRSNIAHFARDSLWLHGLLQRNETLEALGFPQRLTERVLTKLAATECIENGQCAKSRTLDEQHLFEMEALMEEVALDHFPALATWNAGEPSLDHPVCFEVLLQRWRPWAGDVQEIQSFRQSAMKRCKIPDDGMQKKILLLKRESFSRRWKDEAQVIAHFKALAVSVGATFVTANLGRLTPCEQVGVLHNVMLMVGVHGADLTNMIFLPAKAAVLEIGVECELEGASVDSPFWRGPGTWMNHSILKYARESWKIQQQQGLCPPVGSILPPDQWLQGYPTSQFAKLARQANLLYSAVMDCGGAACHREQLPGEFDRGWCNSP